MGDRHVRLAGTAQGEVPEVLQHVRCLLARGGWERIEGRGRRQCTHTPPLPTGAELERQLAKCTPGATRTFRL